MGDDQDGRAAFAALFTELSPRVYAYACRHIDAVSAQDVVADTFLIAWRRWDTVPEHAPLPWLLVVARNTISNRHRAQLRSDRLTGAAEVLARLAGPGTGIETDVVHRDAVLRALDDLSALEREALLLLAWDGLDAREAAAVAGCSVRAFHVRLSRARARVRRSLAADDRAAEDAGNDTGNDAGNDTGGSASAVPLLREAR